MIVQIKFFAQRNACMLLTKRGCTYIILNCGPIDSFPFLYLLCLSQTSQILRLLHRLMQKSAVKGLQCHSELESQRHQSQRFSGVSCSQTLYDGKSSVVTDRLFWSAFFFFINIYIFGNSSLGLSKEIEDTLAD